VYTCGHAIYFNPVSVATVSTGKVKNIFWPDNWTATTIDGKRSAQFEHTLLITKDGVERLTGKIETSPKYFWEE